MNQFPGYAPYFQIMASKIKEISDEQLDVAKKIILEAKAKGGRTLCFGNGGSASIAAHTATDLAKGAKTPALCFNEANLITCLANDFGFEHWMSKALEMNAKPNDCVLLISSSGSSKNVLNAGVFAKKMNIPVITFSGFKSENPLRKIGDVNFWVDSQGYNIVEMVHHVWISAIVDSIVGAIEYPAS